MAIDPKKLSTFGKKKGAEHDEPGEPHDHDEHEHDEEHGKKKGNPHHVDVGALVDRIEKGQGDPELMELAEEVDPEDLEDAPAWALDEDLWEKAHDLSEPHFDEVAEPSELIAHVYKELGGEVDTDADEEGEEEE